MLALSEWKNTLPMLAFRASGLIRLIRYTYGIVQSGDIRSRKAAREVLDFEFEFDKLEQLVANCRCKVKSFKARWHKFYQKSKWETYRVLHEFCASRRCSGVGFGAA